MTLFVTHRSRTSAPRAFATPVVRELPSAPAATGEAIAW
jgi:hypothetical protein